MRRAAAMAPILAGLYLCACNRDFGNPSDPDADRFTVRSEAFLERLGDREPVEGDTLRLRGGVASEPVERDGLVVRYAWDLDGDGSVDTVLSGTDSLSLIASGAGNRKVGLTLTDKAGFTSSAGLAFKVHPKLESVFRMKRYDSDCPAYAQEPILMRLALAVSQFAFEKTREEGMRATDMVLKIAQAVTGTGNPLGMLDGFEYAYGRGVYRFKNEGIDLDVAFHYGPGLADHAEGDTIRANLFSLDSYIADIDINVFPPSVKYAKGPLAGLIDGDIDMDISDIRHPRFDFRVDFNRVRMSFARETHGLFALSNQEITLVNALFFTRYDGKAKMAPAYPGTLIRLYGRDSLELDFSGTKVSSPVLPISWTYESGGEKDSAVYRLALTQETLHQVSRFGDAGGVKKVSGTYEAVNRLGEGGGLQAVYFKGAYSSTEPDSARFYCREAREDSDFFGAAAFETATPGRGAFSSERYGYGFGFPFSTFEPWSAGAGVSAAIGSSSFATENR
jgi:hypothetical protein